jgi:hypothetical protein
MQHLRPVGYYDVASTDLPERREGMFSGASVIIPGSNSNPFTYRTDRVERLEPNMHLDFEKNISTMNCELGGASAGLTERLMFDTARNVLDENG